jgi:hypothetical protein
MGIINVAAFTPSPVLPQQSPAGPHLIPGKLSMRDKLHAEQKFAQAMQETAS